MRIEVLWVGIRVDPSVLFVVPDSGIVEVEDIPEVLKISDVITLAGDTVEDISNVVTCDLAVVRLVFRVD